MTITRTDAAERTHRVRDDSENEAPPARRETPHSIREGNAARQLERMPSATHYLAFLTSVPAPPIANVGATRDQAIQAKLDGVRDAFSGPYIVEGMEVTARPMFRMLRERPAPMVTAVYAAAAQAGVPAYPAIVGQCTPRQLVKITQALIAAGRLPPGPADVATRIRQMQWDHGIGVDCAGYSKQAIAASALRTPEMYQSGWESFRDLDSKRAGSFAKQSLEDARPGDLITLDPIAPEIYGHNVVVYSHTTADASQAARLASTHGPDVAAFLLTRGPHHVLEVDSSWGAGAEGSQHGGFRRDTWLYDASTKTWGSFDPRSTPARFEVSLRGPSGDAYHGTYRPR
jgi:hypothetical protein